LDAYFETVSLIEQVLQRDPAGVYGRMDFLSRDRYRQAVEELAEPTGEAQLRVALRSVESARQAAELKSSDDRAAHVGYHLIGKGRRELETDVAYAPRLAVRVHRFLFAHVTSVYLGAIGLITATLLAPAVAYGQIMGGAPWILAVSVVLLLLPASEFAIALVQRLAAHFVTPRRLPGSTFAGVPEDAGRWSSSPRSSRVRRAWPSWWSTWRSSPWERRPTDTLRHPRRLRRRTNGQATRGREILDAARAACST
jgi:cyclic beta-1,2-glucan synthetase